MASPETRFRAAPPVLPAPPGNSIGERTGRLFLGGGGVQRDTLERRKVMSMPTPRACLKPCWRVTAGLPEASRTLGYCLEHRHHAVPVMPPWGTSPHTCQSKPECLRLRGTPSQLPLLKLPQHMPDTVRKEIFRILHFPDLLVQLTLFST